MSLPRCSSVKRKLELEGPTVSNAPEGGAGWQDEDRGTLMRGDSQVMWSGGRGWLSLPRTLFSSHWNHAFATPYFSLRFSFFISPFPFPSLSFLPFPLLRFLSPHSQLCTSHLLQVYPTQRQQAKCRFPPSFISSMFSLYSWFIIIITALQSLPANSTIWVSIHSFLLWIGCIFLCFICWVIFCCVLDIMSVILWRHWNLLYSYGECWDFALVGNKFGQTQTANCFWGSSMTLIELFYP